MVVCYPGYFDIFECFPSFAALVAENVGAVLAFGSVGLFFAHVGRFWDVGPELGPCWAYVGPPRAMLVSGFV